MHRYYIHTFLILELREVNKYISCIEDVAELEHLD